MTTRHISDLTWDRRFAGELPAALVEEVQRHAAGCAPCTARAAELEAEHRRFQASPPPLPAPGAPPLQATDDAPPRLDGTAPAPGPSRWWRMRWGIPALAAALASVVVLPRIMSHLGGAPEPTTRSKGGFAVTAFAGRNGDAVALGAGDPIFPGDRLQLTYSAERAGHLAVLGIDGAGAVGVYFPPDGATTWAAAAGHRIALPTSTALDDVIGRERLWVVHCDQPQPLAALAARVAAEGVGAAPPAGCAVQRLSFDKRARTGADRR